MAQKWSQSRMVLEHILAGNSITTLEAVHRFGSIQLPGRMIRLEKAGVALKKVRIKVLARHGKVIVTKYSLSIPEEAKNVFIC